MVVNGVHMCACVFVFFGCIVLIAQFTFPLFPAGVCMLQGSLASSPYFRPDSSSREVIELQYQAIANYFCDATANYDLLPLIRNSILFISGAQVSSKGSGRKENIKRGTPEP